MACNCGCQLTVLWDIQPLCIIGLYPWGHKASASQDSDHEALEVIIKVEISHLIQ